MFYLIQWTWGLLQNLIGLLFYLYLDLRFHPEKERFQKCCVIHYPFYASMSLGMFIFYSKYNTKEILRHEYGHSIQSLLLGPFYLLMIGLPSFLWSNLSYFQKLRQRNNYDYYQMPIEKWANLLANRYL